jgi:tetratricopeptide (TPR) repeat protein
MKNKTRSISHFVLVIAVAASFALCQKGGPPPALPAGGEEAAMQKGEAVTPDEGKTNGKEGKKDEKKILTLPEVYVGPWKAKGEQPDLFKKAEKEFEKKNYKAALGKYEELVKSDPTNYWTARAKLQEAVCHFQLGENDEALDVLTALLGSKPGLLWEARAMIVLAELYRALPYYGYEREGRVYYNQEVREGEYKYMDQEHRELSTGYREKARVALLALLSAPADKRGAAEGDDLKAELIANSFSLVESFEGYYSGTLYDPCPPSAPKDPPAKGSAYDQGWTDREKALFLLNEIPDVNEGRSDTHPAAWALFTKTLFLMRYPKCASAEWMKKNDEEYKQWSEKHKDELDPPQYRPTPYKPPADMDPLEIIGKVIAGYPDDKDADLYMATKGRVLESREEFVAAKKVYEEFLQKFKKSPWEDDVKSSLHQIEHPTLSPYGKQVSYAQEEDVIDIYSRNVK